MRSSCAFGCASESFLNTSALVSPKTSPSTLPRSSNACPIFISQKGFDVGFVKRAVTRLLRALGCFGDQLADFIAVTVAFENLVSKPNWVRCPANQDFLIRRGC